MESISLGQIAGILTFLTVLIGGITTIITILKKFISKILKPIEKKIDDLQENSSKSRNNIELELIKMILVNFVNDIDQGISKTPIQKQNAYELFDRYQTLGGNSYVHDRWMKLKDEGKL